MKNISTLINWVWNQFITVTNTDHILAQKSKGLSDESIKLPTTFDNSLAPSLYDIGVRTRLKFDD